MRSAMYDGALLAALVLGASVTAQTAVTPAAPVSATSASLMPCRVKDLMPNGAPLGGAGQLVAICGTQGAMLGLADRYTATVNPVLGSVLVVLTRAGRTKVLLVSPAAAATAVRTDDLTRELARRGGRAPDSGLGGLTVDTSRFATDASIGVKGAASRLDLTVYATNAAAAAASTTGR